MLLSANITVRKTDVKRLNKIKELLTIRNPDYGKRFMYKQFHAEAPPEFLTFLEETKDGKSYILPRNLPLDYFHVKPRIHKSIGHPTEFKFNAKLREYQAPLMGEIITDAESDIILDMPCGHGKTVCALYLTAKRKTTTLVLVPTNYLAEQWENSAKQVLGGAKIGRANPAKKLDYWNYDFYIISFDLVSARDFDEEFYRYWGHVILDEAHRTGAPAYHPIVNNLTAYWRTALTATFRRGDGMHEILRFHFGRHYQLPFQFKPVLCQPYATGIEAEALLNLAAIAKKKIGPKLIPRLIQYLDASELEYRVYKAGFLEMEAATAARFVNQVKKDYLENKLNKTTYTHLLRVATQLKDFRIKPLFALMDSFMAMHPTRNKMVMKMITESLKQDRTVLVLSRRKEALKSFKKQLDNMGVPTALILSKKDKATEKDTSFIMNEAKVILGIEQLAKEGLDIPRLDTLVLHLPLRDTEQAFGRIGRLCEGKQQPMVMYPVDSVNMYHNLFLKSKRFMKANAECLRTVDFRVALSKL